MQKSFFTLTKTWCFSLAVFALAACSSTVNASLSTKAAKPNQITHTQSKNADANKVLSAYRQWVGTRYRLEVAQPKRALTAQPLLKPQ